MTPKPDGLTIVKASNGQGKSTAVDSIIAALAGKGYCFPDAVTHGEKNGSVTVSLTNGLEVTRVFDSGDTKLKVISSDSGMKGNQSTIDSFLSVFSLRIDHFLRADDKQKANVLLKSIGKKDELDSIDNRIKEIYNERTAVGRLLDTARANFDSMPLYSDVPDAPVSISELMQEIEKKRQINLSRKQLEESILNKKSNIDIKEAMNTKRFSSIAELEEQIVGLREDIKSESAGIVSLKDDIKKKESELSNLPWQNDEYERNSIMSAEAVNEKIRANLGRKDTYNVAEKHKSQYDELTGTIESLRLDRVNLLKNSNLPHPGLTVNDEGQLMYNDFIFSTGVEESLQLRIAIAIAASIKKDMGFVLIDNLERLDHKSTIALSEWAQEKGIQIIATKVIDDGNGIIIE
jgi:hypothetical protein